MRKNLAKHTAKKLPLAKRVLALCFALIFVCSCLLPAFANGTGAELETPDTEVVEAAAPGAEPEPMDLYDEPAAVADEPEALDDNFAMDDEPAAMDDQVEKPVVDDEPAAMDDQVENPVEGDEPPVADDTPAKEGATKTTTDANDNIVYEYDTSGTTFPDDDAAALPDGDQMQVDAAFSIPTNIYHFWLKKMSSYDLADIADAAKTAEMTVEQYLAMYGTDKGCYHIMTAADGANLKDYQFANPTSNDDPEGNSRTFAGWYYTDDLGDEQKFVFDECLYVSEGTTVEVYAKWKAEAKPVTTTAELNALETTVTVDGLAGVDTVKVSQLDEYDEADLAEAIEDKIDTEKNIDLYTFDLTPVDKDEKTVQPDSGKKATVTIKGFDILSTDTIKVFHKTNLEVEDLSNTAKLDANGNLTFKTESFSPFAVVVERAVEKSDDEDSESKSGSLSLVSVQTDNEYQYNSGDYAPLYLYVLKPGKVWSDGAVSGNENWFGIGIAKIKKGTLKAANDQPADKIVGVNSVKDLITNGTIVLEPYSGSYTYAWSWPYGGRTSQSQETLNYEGKELYPNLSTTDGAAGGNREYMYWNGEGTQPTDKYYTLEWVSTSLPFGAPASGYNFPEHTAGTYPMYHLDAVVHFSTMLKVEFMTWEPNATGFEKLNPLIYSSEVSEGTNESRIVRPENQNGDDAYDIAGTSSEHAGYKWDGWYEDEACKIKANFNKTIEKDKVYYGKWIPNTQNITITKHVTGLFGDKDREFNFSVSLNPTATDVTATKNLRESSTQDVTNLSSFTLRHNDSITLNGVPVGTVITITESGASDYTVTATGATGSEQTGDNARFTYTVVANSASTQSLEDGESDIALMSTTEEVVPNNSITITNTFDAPVDNGVLLDTLPYILILVVVVGGGVLLFLRKRKNDDDE